MDCAFKQLEHPTGPEKGQLPKMSMFRSDGLECRGDPFDILRFDRRRHVFGSYRRWDVSKSLARVDLPVQTWVSDGRTQGRQLIFRDLRVSEHSFINAGASAKPVPFTIKRNLRKRRPDNNRGATASIPPIQSTRACEDRRAPHSTWRELTTGENPKNGIRDVADWLKLVWYHPSPTLNRVTAKRPLNQSPTSASGAVTTWWQRMNNVLT